MKIILIVFLIATLCWYDLNAADVFTFERLSGRFNDHSDGLCPNKKTKCSATGTCCKTKHNSYHCCLYANAVCCSDKYHCCPNGTTCDVENKRCNRNIVDTVNEPMEWKVENDNDKEVIPMTQLVGSDTLLAPSASLSSDQTCPNNKTKCKDTKTCCITKSGNYYCCPHKNAVCCSDKWLCCPEGSTCDVKNQKCESSKIETKMEIVNRPIDHLNPVDLVVSEVKDFFGFFRKLDRQCINSEKSCPGEKKCCPMESDKFGCCTYRKGVCCPDLLTCCPHGTKCDVKNKACAAVPESLVPISNAPTQVDNTCPDNSTTCVPGETCCSVGNALYGCCPFKDATCCDDKASCCPHNKRCDLANHRCVAKDGQPTRVGSERSGKKKRESLVIFLNKIGLNTTCPDKSVCPENTTCCPTVNNKYGCCPYEQGICCSDLSTCCPSGTTCDKGGCT